jgi:hypothetical protein
LPHQRPQLPAFLDGSARIQAVLQRAFLLPRGAPDPGASPCIRQRGRNEFLVLPPSILTSENAGDWTPSATSILIDENCGRGPCMRLIEILLARP